MTATAYNIVLVPDAGLAGRAVDLSKRLQAQKARFVLSPTGPFPHLSLYMVQLQKGVLDEAKLRLQHIAAITLPIEADAAAYAQEAGYIDIAYRKSRTLSDLQMEIVCVINPLRGQALRPRDAARLAAFPEPIRANVERYGYRYVGESFRPHLTFTRFVSEVPIDTAGLPDPADFGGAYPRLGLFELGANGTCIKEIANFPLLVA